MATETHIAGLDILWDGRYHVQRCAWCGATLQAYDYNQMMYAPNEDGSPHTPAAWPVGALVRCSYDGVVAVWGTVALSRTIRTVIEPEPSDEHPGDVRLPEDACVRHLPMEA